YVKSLSPSGKAEAIGEVSSNTLGRVFGAGARVVLTMIVLGILFWVASRVDFNQLSIASSPSQSYADPAAQRFIGRAQMSRIQAAIEVYELEKGEAPQKLEALVETGLLGNEDLHYP